MNPPRRHSYGPNQRHAIALVRDLTRQLRDTERLLDDAVLYAWKAGVTLPDIGEVGAFEGETVHGAKVWASRARDRALAREKVRSSGEVH